MLSQPQITPFPFHFSPQHFHMAEQLKAAYFQQAMRQAHLQQMHKKPEQNKPVHIIQNNLNASGKRPYEYETAKLDKYERLTKKVKTDETGMSPSTQDGGSDYVRSPSKSDVHCSDAVSQKCLSPVQNFETKASKEVQIKEKKPKTERKKIDQIVFDYDSDQVMFKLMSKAQGTEDAKMKSMTREQVLEEDPMILLEFYESQLKFAKAIDFNPSQLKNI